MARVKALDPINFSGKFYELGSEIDGLTNSQAEQLAMYGSAEILMRDESASDAEIGVAVPAKSSKRAPAK